MQIEYRTFVPGDETQLATVFNRCFHQEGSGFCRTAKSILWRYLKRPDGCPDEVQIAEDKTTNEIVGVVYSSIEYYILCGVRVKAGCINDVSVLPSYARLGIAKKLMVSALYYFDRIGAHISVLSAEEFGFAQRRLYIPLKFDQIHTSKVFFLLNFNLLKYVPPGIFGLPLILQKAHKLKRQFKHARKLLHKLNLEIKIIYSNQISAQTTRFLTKLWECYKKWEPSYFHSFRDFSLNEWLYFRGKSYIPSLTPNYVILYDKKAKKIQGFLSFRKQWIYLEKWGFRAPLGITREWLLNPKFMNNLQNFTLLMSALLFKANKAAVYQNCTALLLNYPNTMNIQSKILRKTHQFNISGPAYMIKSLKNKPEELPAIQANNPFKLGAGEIFLYP